jgi:SDR family mycofactocin-dependent oxidoreductase
LVTGAGRGQGRSHALRFAAEGASVLALDVCADNPAVQYPLATREELDETIALAEKEGVRAIPLVADVRDSAALDAAIAAGVKELGGLDAVAVNAGIQASYTVTGETPDAAWEAVIGVNLTGAFYTARACLPHLQARGRGSIVFTGSVCSFKAPAHIVAYNVSKHGILGLMRTLAVEYGPEFIRVNTVLPTSVDTMMIRNDACVRIMRPDLENPQFEDTVESFQGLNLLPVGIVQPGDISDAVLFLSSDEAKYLTGVALPIDAGALVK